jgi:hypothetical protein
MKARGWSKRQFVVVRSLDRMICDWRHGYPKGVFAGLHVDCCGQRCGVVESDVQSTHIKPTAWSTTWKHHAPTHSSLATIHLFRDGPSILPNREIPQDHLPVFGPNASRTIRRRKDHCNHGRRHRHRRRNSKVLCQSRCFSHRTSRPQTPTPPRHQSLN